MAQSLAPQTAEDLSREIGRLKLQLERALLAERCGNDAGHGEEETVPRPDEPVSPPEPQDE